MSPHGALASIENLLGKAGRGWLAGVPRAGACITPCVFALQELLP